MNNIKIINIKELHPFQNNPFKIKDTDDFKALTDSIKDYGIIEPVIVRKRLEGGYEIISGHRRIKACEMAGVEKAPALVRDMDRNTAVITLVDSNIHRENILPSERAFAYKMKLEAIKHQGKTSSQLATKSSLDEVGVMDNISGDTVWRYVRLTNLSSDILQLVDDNKIAISPAVALSYLTEKEQLDLYETIQSEDCTPSYAQSIQFKKLSQQGMLDMDKIFEIMTEIKPNQQEVYKFKRDDIRKFFPKSYTDKQIQDTLFKLLEQWQRKQKQDRESR